MPATLKTGCRIFAYFFSAVSLVTLIALWSAS